MTAPTLLASAFGGIVAAMAGFSLAMPRHYRQCYPRHSPPPPDRRALLRWGSWALLAVSLALCVRSAGIGTGLVYWFGFLSTAGICVALVLSYTPGRLPVVSGGALPLALTTPLLALLA